MSATTETTMIRIERKITVVFSPEEFLSAEGDRKGKTRRNARAIQVRITYTFSDGVWSCSWHSIQSLVEQQKVDGSWSEPKWTIWGGLGVEVDRELMARFMPQTIYTVTEATK